MKEFIMQETEEMTTFGSVWKRYEPVVELVRCKNCRHVCLCDAEEMFPDMPVYAKCTLTDETHEPDWYCADGEHKKSEGEA